MGAMPCFGIASMGDGSARLASIPPCSAGCSVLTLPSSISGNWVTEATSSTASPASISVLAVPPVETSLTPCLASAWAKATRPLLSETEISARLTVRRLASGIDVLRTEGSATIVPMGGAINQLFRALVAPALHGPFDRNAVRSGEAAQYHLLAAAQGAGSEIDALGQIDRRARRLEAPAVAARQAQQHAARRSGRGLNFGMEMETDGEAAARAPRAGCALEPVLAAQILAVGRQIDLAAVDQAESRAIGVMARAHILVAVLLAALRRNRERRPGEMPVGRDFGRAGITDDERRMRRGGAHGEPPRRLRATLIAVEPGAAIDQQPLGPETHLQRQRPGMGGFVPRARRMRAAIQDHQALPGLQPLIAHMRRAWRRLARGFGAAQHQRDERR